ncbi:recombinase family protein [Nocardia gipuzkoensis]|uniref:recombinase family protein n=1 Tax=Nocardia gipuzkoensis TaxID=2749991 RepID=UPI001E2DEC8E|nr:recombinase family protein [Nocardia gipuzkoensis]UGT72375.1 recombinase family protein [Nocardia gipuzkoensis]
MRRERFNEHSDCPPSSRHRANGPGSVDVEGIVRRHLRAHNRFRIPNRLTTERISCPSAYDRDRNCHRSAVAWSKSAVRSILTNPRYTGYEVGTSSASKKPLSTSTTSTLDITPRLSWLERHNTSLASSAREATPSLGNTLYR